MSNKTGASNLPGLRKSIRKVVIANNRRRVNSETAAAASPKLSAKRKRIASLTEQTTEEPLPKRMAAEKTIMAALANLQNTMGELKAKVDSIPNRDDFEKMDANVKSMRKEIADNTDQLQAITKRQDTEGKEFVKKVEKIIDLRLANIKTNTTGVLTPTVAEAEKEKLYWMARRTMLLWPVDLAAEAGNAVRNFMEKVLDIPRLTVKSLNIERVDKLEQGRRS